MAEHDQQPEHASEEPDDVVGMDFAIIGERPASVGPHDIGGDEPPDAQRFEDEQGALRRELGEPTWRRVLAWHELGVRIHGYYEKEDRLDAATAVAYRHLGVSRSTSASVTGSASA